MQAALGRIPSGQPEKGFLAIGVCNSPRHGHFVIPWGGREGRLATNPISFAAPNGLSAPIVADFSTAESSEGAIRLHRNMGKLVPDGWILRATAKKLTIQMTFMARPAERFCPSAASADIEASLLDCLWRSWAAFSAVRVSPLTAGNGLGFIVVDISAFADPDEFANMMQEMRDYIKSSPPSEGFEQVLLPGEPDFCRMKQRMTDGIPIDQSTWEQICEAAFSVGVDPVSLELQKL